MCEKLKKKLVKRVIATPGDNLLITQGNVFINGKLIEENYINKDTYTYGNVNIVIPLNYIFVMGDNRMNSRDSRDKNIGIINMNNIEGKIIIKIYESNNIFY
ncbi:signal peptidase I [Clostridioides difficile]|uniref:signal peptidase I n=1 Tax=Clostridioides difficile TaxID=1496 RepID=UPI0027953855|nr:signal peptidase I [Clostridioides difficile]